MLNRMAKKAVSALRKLAGFGGFVKRPVKQKRPAFLSVMNEHPPASNSISNNRNSLSLTNGEVSRVYSATMGPTVGSAATQQPPAEEEVMSGGTPGWIAK